MARSRLIYAVDMLHYLPLFIAQRLLGHDIAFERAQNEGDLEAFNSLMQDHPSTSDVKFCVCDPMMVNLTASYSASYADEPIVIGQLVGRAPFWAVNHEDDSFDNEDKFSRYTELYSYPEPNTGYVLGTIAKKRAGGDDCPLERRDKPIHDQLDSYLVNAKSVVLEADILKIKDFQARTSNKIVFNYPSNKRYNNFCFTAIITQKRFLKSSEGQIQAGELLAALQKSLSIIHAGHELALICANDHFTPRGYSSSIIKPALEQLRSDGIFPKSLIVTTKAWDKSTSLRTEANAAFIKPSRRKYVCNRLAEQSHLSLHKLLRQNWSFFIIKNYLNTPALIPFLLTILFLGWLVAPLMGGPPHYFRDCTQHHMRLTWVVFHVAVTFGVAILWLSRYRLYKMFGKDSIEFGFYGLSLFGLYAVSDLVVIAEFYRAVG